MSWRRLSSLVAGLSGEAVTRVAIANRPLSDPLAIAAAFDGGLGVPDVTETA